MPNDGVYEQFYNIPKQKSCYWNGKEYEEIPETPALPSPVPEPPQTETYTLKSVGGTIQWVKDSQVQE
jgi:hypothetical protein